MVTGGLLHGHGAAFPGSQKKACNEGLLRGLQTIGFVLFFQGAIKKCHLAHLGKKAARELLVEVQGLRVGVWHLQTRHHLLCAPAKRIMPQLQHSIKVVGCQYDVKL